MTLGRIFALVGPSGAGKDTLLAGARAALPDLCVVRRAITRPAEAGGEDYEALSDHEFDRRLALGEFALHWGAHGLRYGIPKAGLLPRARGRDVIFNGSRGALVQAVAAIPDLIVLQVTVPPDVLAARLAARGRETAPEIAARVARADTALPPGLARIDIANDTTPAAGIARLIAALQPPVQPPVRG